MTDIMGVALEIIGEILNFIAIALIIISFPAMTHVLVFGCCLGVTGLSFNVFGFGVISSEQ